MTSQSLPDKKEPITCHACVKKIAAVTDQDFIASVPDDLKGIYCRTSPHRDIICLCL